MKQPAEHKQEKERCILVGISTPKIRNWMASEQLAELGRLAETAGAVVVKSFLQRVQNFNPATLIGEGKVNEVKRALEEENAKMVVFDDDLSGSQVRNLEQRLPGIKVLDRTGLILDIFAKHAITAESRLMVEVAQLQYMMPRLTGAWTHLCRQHNGGIGTKGPGETQLETDRRMIRKRIQELKKKLEKIEEARESQAENRNDIFQVGIVGYTNAGKSGLSASSPTTSSKPSRARSEWPHMRTASWKSLTGAPPTTATTWKSRTRRSKASSTRKRPASACSTRPKSATRRAVPNFGKTTPRQSR